MRHYGKIESDLQALDQLLRRLLIQAGALRFVYEAGACGYRIYRHLMARGFPCLVAAPSLPPWPPRRQAENRPSAALFLLRTGCDYGHER